MAAITAGRVLQKSESLRAKLRYCQCGLGDNYLLNKLPNPLAKHTAYPRKSCAIIKPRKTIDGFFKSGQLGVVCYQTDPHCQIGRVTAFASEVIGGNHLGTKDALDTTWFSSNRHTRRRAAI